MPEEDTPQYFERPECASCIMQTLKQIGSETSLANILVTKEQKISQLIAAYEQLRRRHSDLLCKIADKANGRTDAGK